MKNHLRARSAAHRIIVSVAVGVVTFGAVGAAAAAMRAGKTTAVTAAKPVAVVQKPAAKPVTTPAPAKTQPTATKPAPVAPAPAPASAPAAKPTPHTAAVSAPAAAQTVSSAAPAPSSSVNALQPTGGSTSSQTAPASSSSSGSTSSGSSTSSSSAPAAAPAATPPAHYSSTNWSGYAALSGTFSSVAGAWTVPMPTSTSTTDNSMDAAWVGIGGVNNNDLIQTGTDDVVAPDGTITVSAFYELLPANAVFIQSLAVSAGDHMSAHISESSPGVWALSISDQTSGQSYSTTLNYTSSHSSAEWIEEDPSYGNGSLAPLDNFGMVNFSGSTANGALADTFSLGAITLVSHSQPVATPGAMNSGAFSVAHS